jgi:tetratricopeptide (TPR) repeat protein
MKGFYSEAERALQKALALDVDDLMANYHMAALRAAQGDTDRCLESLTKAAAVDKDKVRLWVEGDRFFDVVRRLPAFVALFDG